MRLFGLVCLVMVAFAANSVLTRAGLVGGGIDVAGFGAMRLLSGAVVLLGLMLAQGARVAIWSRARGLSVLGLLLYIGGFTAAYIGMDSGLGALLLFGTVQITMFGGAVVARETLPPLRIVGALVAVAGLLYLVWPFDAIASGAQAVLAMVLAGIGWGLYSLVGRGSRAPLADTAVNFAMAGVIFGLGWLAMGSGIAAWHWQGVLLAVLSGAMTSGLGYALWYAVLPRLEASVAAVAQLTVPPIAALGGVLFLGETLTMKFVVAAVVILGGVALSVLGPRLLR